MNDERLREFYQASLEARRGEERSGCVSAEQLQALSEGRLAETDALTVADHAMGCAYCRDEYALLRAMVQAAPAEGPVLSRRLALAASLVLVIGAAAVWQAVRTREGSIERGGETEILLAQPDARAGQALSLVWHAVPGASRYEVELLDSAGATVQRATTRDTLFVVADSVRLMAGARHSWWVRAVFPDGRELRSSVNSFRVR